MRDILISSAVCVACLMLALISQLVAPSVVAAAVSGSGDTAAVTALALATPGSPVQAAIAAPLELDPEDPNPILFTMAPDPLASVSSSDNLMADTAAAALGGEMVAPKERTTASGLRITDLVEGSGDEAQRGQVVEVNYRGTLQSGREFDSSYGRGPFSFPLGAGRVIQGWDEGVAGMKVGGKRKLVIPPELGYGSRGAGGVIPPDATLIFDVELLKVGG